MDSSSKDVNITELPCEIFETIFGYLTFHETSEVRAVCKLFNKLCQDRLNKGFNRVDKLHAQIQKEVKNKLPRRESERRNHPLARHVDILSAVETRLSLLGMSYMKYIDSGLCCFIPGKVLDELFAILRTLQCDKQPPRSHEFLQELRDISSMAMEHFDEKIIPGLKQQLPTVTLGFPFSEACDWSSTSQAGTTIASLFPCQSGSSRGPSVRSEINTLRNQMRNQHGNIQEVKKDLKSGNDSQKKKMIEQEKKIIQQGHAIAELEKKVNDLNQKFIDFSAELAKLKAVRDVGEDGKPCLHNEEFRRGDNQLASSSSTTSKNIDESIERIVCGKSLKRKSCLNTNTGTKKLRR